MDKHRNGAKRPDPAAPADTGANLQQVMEMGFHTAKLLQNPIYATVKKIAVDTLIMEWSNTAEHETKKREAIYQRLQAHNDIENIMQNLITRAQDAQKRTQSGTDEYLDEQGFQPMGEGAGGPDYESFQ